MKKFLAILLAIFVLLGLLTACSSKEASETEATTTTQNVEDLIISAVSSALESAAHTSQTGGESSTTTGYTTGTSKNPTTGHTPNRTNAQLSNSVPTTFDTSKPVTITFYHTMGTMLRKVLDKYIKQFNKLYPNITINHEGVGSTSDLFYRLKTEISVNKQPNIAYCYPDHVALYNQSNAVLPLDSLIDNTKTVTRADGKKEQIGLTNAQKADFIPGFYNEGKVYGDGKMYTMPMAKATEVLYYNKTFFKKHNLTPPATWDEMEALCKKIKEIDPDCIPLGYDSASNWFINMCMQQGSPYTSATGNHFLFNNEQNRAFVTRFRDWYQKGYVTTQELVGSFTSSLFAWAESEEDNCYMSIASSGSATYYQPWEPNGAYRFDVGIATIPQVDPSNPKVILQGASLCTFKNADPQEVMASWLFVKYLATAVEFQAEYSMASGYMPVIKSAASNTTYKKFLSLADGGAHITALSMKVCLEQASAYFAPPAFIGSDTARNQAEGLMLRCLSADAGGNISAMIQKVFEDAVAECKSQAG